MEQKEISTLKMEKGPIGELPTLKIDTVQHRQGRFIKRLDTAIKIAAPTISLALLYFIASSLYPDSRDFYQDRLKPAILRYWPNSVAVVVLLVVGFNLYLFRGYRRLWFGVAEIAFASGLGWYAINKAVSGTVPDGIVILFAALYLAGRGFVNVASVFRPFKIEQEEMQS